MRVLIVEDDPLLGDGLASGLRSLGFAVDWLTDGAAADRALGEASYDAILLDLGLPGRDGMHWLARWRTRATRTPAETRATPTPPPSPATSPSPATAR